MDVASTVAHETISFFDALFGSEEREQDILRTDELFYILLLENNKSHLIRTPTIFRYEARFFETYIVSRRTSKNSLRQRESSVDLS